MLENILKKLHCSVLGWQTSQLSVPPGEEERRLEVKCHITKTAVALMHDLKPAFLKNANQLVQHVHTFRSNVDFDVQCRFTGSWSSKCVWRWWRPASSIYAELSTLLSVAEHTLFVIVNHEWVMEHDESHGEYACDSQLQRTFHSRNVS